jgi:phage portal protein BeeE
MALFGSKKQDATPAFAHAPLQAAAGSASQSGLGQFWSYTVGAASELALSVPTVSRATQMIISLVGSLPLRHYTTQFNGERYEKIYLENESWMDTPDPTLTRNFVMSNLCMDLMMRGRAFLYVTSRSSATGRPLAFQWMPCEMVDTLDQPGPQFFGKSNSITFNGINIPTQDVIQFLAPVQGFLWTGRRVLETAIKLDRSAERFASNEIVAGYLQQTDSSEPLDAESLGELAAAWSNARRVNAVGALNSAVKYEQFDTDPSRLQLIEARNFSALELSRAIGVPAYLLGIGISGYNYSNATQAKQDLYLLGAKLYMDAIQETLSGSDILPRNRFVEFDTEDLIADVEMNRSEIDIEEPASMRTPQEMPS